MPPDHPMCLIGRHRWATFYFAVVKGEEIRLHYPLKACQRCGKVKKRNG